MNTHLTKLGQVPPKICNSAFEIRNSLFLRPYQRDAFENRTHGIECWLWGRQTGKSFTLAAWAVDRLLTRPGRLVTILSNSLSNGAELNQKCAEIARLYEKALCHRLTPTPNPNFTLNPNPLTFEQDTPTPNIRFECMSYEIRVRIGGAVSRIKILPANPRTARGFSGDLILDEFAFHENSAAIWEAAEPILSANPDYLCRIASTPNGRHNMFYRLVTDSAIPTRIISRSEAWRQGLPIAHPVTRAPITPDEARALAHDKRAYDQNYECIFEAENMALLTFDLISAAEDPNSGVICDDTWSTAALDILREAHPDVRCGAELQSASSNLVRSQSPTSEASAVNQQPPQNSTFGIRNFYIGVDVGRTQDLTVISILEKTADLFIVRAMLRLRNMRLPQQQELLELACQSPRFGAAQIDMTGLGLGLFEYTQQRFGDRIRGLNFASSIPLAEIGIRNSTFAIRHSERPRVPVPELLALRLLQLYEAKRIRHPIDSLLREDLRKPERVTSSDGRVSIVAARTSEGHADHFWSLALAVDAAMRTPDPQIYVPRIRNLMRISRTRFC
jgi:phage FluMu gp28-like protein